MNATSVPTPASATVELAPSYKIPLALVVLALPLLWINSWVAGLVSLFGLFLVFQTATLRLRFTPTDLDIYRGDSLLRRFPYADWSYWQIFWTPVPILFYFREVKSIHFLPILFDPKALRACLNDRVPLPTQSQR